MGAVRRARASGIFHDQGVRRGRGMSLAKRWCLSLSDCLSSALQKKWVSVGAKEEDDLDGDGDGDGYGDGGGVAHGADAGGDRSAALVRRDSRVNSRARRVCTVDRR